MELLVSSHEKNYVIDGARAGLRNDGRGDIVIVHKPSRAEIAQRTKHLVEELLTAKNGPDLDLNRTTEKVARLRDHLMDYPASRTIAVQNPRFIPFLKRCQALVPPNRSNVFHQCLVLSGHTEALKGSGIRVLSIDGGGTRGLIGLEVLEALEKASGGKKISEMFDLIVGVMQPGRLLFGQNFSYSLVINWFI